MTDTGIWISLGDGQTTPLRRRRRIVAITQLPSPITTTKTTATTNNVRSSSGGEEGGGHLLGREQIQQLGRPLRVRSVVESQRDRALRSVRVPEPTDHVGALSNVFLLGGCERHLHSLRAGVKARNLTAVSTDQKDADQRSSADDGDLLARGVACQGRSEPLLG